jgi:hypothetical protein
VAVYAITPYSAFGNRGDPSLTVVNVRYAQPALMLAAVVTALAGRFGRRAELVVVLAAAVGVGDAFRRTAGLNASVTGIALAVAALAAAVAVAWAWRSPRAARARRAIAAAALLLVLGGAWIAYHERTTGPGYDREEPAVSWVLKHASAGRRIALAGYWDDNRLSPAYPSFGPRYGNDVRFVGPVRDGLLEVYRSPASFGAALRRGHFDVVVVGLRHGKLPGLPGGSAYVRWARAAGFTEVGRSARLVALRAPPA